MTTTIVSETKPMPSAEQDRRFRRMLMTKLLVDIAEYALAYALLIAIVRRTGSGIHSTLLVAAFTVPAIIFGVPAGAIADRLPKREVLVGALLLRSILLVLLVRWIGDLWRTYAIIFAFAAVGQVFGPIWVAVLPHLVPMERLSRANALLNLVQLGGQVLGVVVLAPILLKTINERAVFVVAGCLLIGALVVTIRNGRLPRGMQLESPPRERVRDYRASLLAGWRVIDADERIFIAAIQLTIVASLLKSLIVLFPYYTREVLAIDPDNTVFVAAPIAIGAALGLALAPALTRLNRGKVATAGFVMLTTALGGMALVNLLRPIIADHLHLGFTGLAHAVGIPPIVTTAMLFAIPLGFGLMLNLVAARTVLNERAPRDVQARVFATQNALANIVTLIPLFIVGALTSLIGARPVMLLATVASLGLPIILVRRRAARLQMNAQSPSRG